MKAMTTSSSQSPARPRPAALPAPPPMLPPQGDRKSVTRWRFLGRVADRAVTLRGRAGPVPRSLAALPFIELRPDGPDDYWAVEPTNDYVRSCDEGSRYAVEFLRFLETERAGSACDSILGAIVSAMIREAQTRPPLEGDATCGYVTGFFQTLSAVLSVGLEHCDPFVVEVAYACEVGDIELASTLARLPESPRERQ